MPKKIIKKIPKKLKRIVKGRKELGVALKKDIKLIKSDIGKLELKGIRKIKQLIKKFKK